MHPRAFALLLFCVGLLALALSLISSLVLSSSGAAIAVSSVSVATALAASLPALSVAAFAVTASRSALSAARFPVAPVAVIALAGVAEAAWWSPELCVRPTGVGSTTGGRPFTILGEAGSSVTALRVYRNNGKDGYLRGIVVSFSNGMVMRGGVRKDQFAELVLSDGETFTGMTLWKSAAGRVARIDVATTSRTWGYGVDSTAGLSSTAVNVGSGILVGFQGRAGDDLDLLAPIFLRRFASSSVDNIVFKKMGAADGLRLVTLREGSAVWNGTDFTWTFSGSESRDTSTSWTGGSESTFSMGTTFRVSLPVIAENGLEASWSTKSAIGSSKNSGSSTSLTWSTEIKLSEDNPAVSCSAMVWEGRLNVAWHGTQTVVADGHAVSFAVSGLLNHVAYGKVETVCRPLEPPDDDDDRKAKRWVA